LKILADLKKIKSLQAKEVERLRLRGNEV